MQEVSRCRIIRAVILKSLTGCKREINVEPRGVFRKGKDREWTGQDRKGFAISKMSDSLFS